MSANSEHRLRWRPGRHDLSEVQRNPHLARDLGLAYRPRPAGRIVPW